VLYPQNDDRIVTMDAVTSLHPVYIYSAPIRVIFKRALELQYNYQLSLIDPRDAIVLQTERDDYFDKPVVERRSSEVLST